jgi:hypothetical protein
MDKFSRREFLGLSFKAGAASIEERQCFNPSVNEAVFPGAPSKVFCTSMEKVGTTDLAYSLDFGGGYAKATRNTLKEPYV